ncbi:MAG: hypothetical protein AB8C84_07540 [Oligoflexales bacterium]
MANTHLHIHAIYFCMIFMLSSSALSKTKIFFIEATMPTTSWTFGLLKHQGLGFQEGEHFIECHFTQKGLLTVKKGYYGRRVLRRELFATGKKTLEDYIAWCETWAKKHKYTLGVFDCWTLVEDFCNAHHITNRRVDHANWVRNILMIRGSATAWYLSQKYWKKDLIVNSFFYFAILPLYASGYGLHSTLQVGYRDFKRFSRKISKKYYKKICRKKFLKIGRN